MNTLKRLEPFVLENKLVLKKSKETVNFTKVHSNEYSDICHTKYIQTKMQNNQGATRYCFYFLFTLEIDELVSKNNFKCLLKDYILPMIA